jgi:hypothetical protein
MSRLLTMCVLSAAVLLPAGCQDKKSTGGGGLATAGRQAMSRADFEAKVKDKSDADVLAAFGQPDQKVPIGGKEEWSYAGITLNPATNKPDIATRLHFTNHRVTKVEYVE